MTEQHDEKEAFYKKIIGFFDHQVLASYRNEPDKYILTTDYFEGHLRIVDHDESMVTTDSINIRFGYRTCVGGDLAVAAYLPDLVDKSSAHIQRWAAFHLEDSRLTTEPDSRFGLWKARYLEGSWSIENGPRRHLEDCVTVINGLCIEVVGQALFKFSNNPVVNRVCQVGLSHF